VVAATVIHTSQVQHHAESTADFDKAEDELKTLDTSELATHLAVKMIEIHERQVRASARTPVSCKTTVP
jgi:hypothetical protein